MSDKQSDGALMLQVARGDQMAFRGLVDDQGAKLFGLAYRMLVDRALAEDVVQEAFLRLWRQADRWRPEARLSTWLYRVVYNLCVDELRARQRLSDEEPPDRADPTDGPLVAKQREQTAEQVNAAISALPLRQRVALTLVYHQELNNSDAAKVMDVTVEALESLLVRGRRKLRQELFSRKEDLIGIL